MRGALEREYRRATAAEKDVEILIRCSPRSELDGLADYAAQLPFGLD